MTITGRGLTTGSLTDDGHVDAVVAALSAIITGPGVPAASCRSHPKHLWDEHLDGETPQQRTARHLQAQTVCRGCPALADCRERRDTSTDHPGGVWAGELYLQGRRTPVRIACRCGAALSDARKRSNHSCEDCSRLAKNAREARRLTALPKPVKLIQCAGCGQTCRKRNNSRYCPDCSPTAAIRRRRTRPPRRCDECGTSFTPRRSSQRFDTETCRKAAKNRSLREKERRAREAARLERDAARCANPGCGRPLTGPQRKHGTLHCSPECRAATSRKPATPPGTEEAA